MGSLQHSRTISGPIFGVLALVADCASAQTTGSRLPGASTAMTYTAGELDESAISTKPSDQAVSIGRRVAACVVAHRRQNAVDYLAAGTQPEREAVLHRFGPVMADCMMAADPEARQLRIGGPALQGALAEVLLARGPAVELAPMEPAREGVPPWLSDKAEERVVQEMAICLADRYPQQSLALVRSAPGSSAEATGFAAIAPMMGPCLVSGTTLHANRMGIRLALASAIYHRVADQAHVETAAEKK